MVRAAVPISAFVAGVATAFLALFVALCTAPGVIMADDMVDALTVVANGSLNQFPRNSGVYIKSSVGTSLLEKLQATHPSLRLRSFSERPVDNGCAATASATPMAPCERNDYLKLEVLSAPTQRTMLVAVGTSNTFGQLWLIKVWGQWRVLVRRSHAV
jgi:hypothetical protein